MKPVLGYVMFDSDILIEMASDESLLQSVLGLQTEGILRVVITHVQRNQLAGASSQATRDKNQRVMDLLKPESVATTASVVGLSTIGEAEVGGDEEDFTDSMGLGAMKKNILKYKSDALIACAAFAKTNLLITNDADLRNHVSTQWPQFPVWSLTNLRTWCQSEGAK